MKEEADVPPITISGIVHDGKLAQAEALEALKNAYISANESLPKAIAQCQTDDDKAKVQDDCDTVKIAYLSSLKKTLLYTGPLFEKVAGNLATEAGAVRQKAVALKNAIEAIGLFTDLVRLAASLALAFG